MSPVKTSPEKQPTKGDDAAAELQKLLEKRETMDQIAKIDAPDLLRSSDKRGSEKGGDSSESDLDRKGSVEYHFVEEKPRT
jgi:hypothetical protein